ncbi:MAG: GGDEF domain-containing protein [Burkholderiaceae bacterium]|nr:GGDEF domain-containing protein [Burkholderiaceae bacterium]
MKTFTVELETMQSVAAGVFARDGVLLAANAGLLRLLPPDVPEPVGARVAHCFIQPDFAALLGACEGNDACYRGLLTIGDFGGKTRTLRGHLWRSEEGLRMLAEYDVVELERLNDTMLDLNQDMADMQNTLARSNVRLQQRETQIVAASLTDPLTGVGNRRLLDQALATEISRAHRSGARLSVIMADIDYFKRVNDEYGHGAGDAVLAHFGQLMRAQTRPTDTVARFGGEEFMILLPDMSLAQAVSKAEKIRLALAAKIIAPMDKIVTSSFGVAELAHDEGGAALLSRVDAALYQAKDQGRNQVVAGS